MLLALKLRCKSRSELLLDLNKVQLVVLLLSQFDEELGLDYVLSRISVHVRQKNFKTFLYKTIGRLNFLVFVPFEHLKADVDCHQFRFFLACQKHAMKSFTSHHDPLLVAFLLSVEALTWKTFIDSIEICNCAPQLRFSLVDISVWEALKLTFSL
jgi:hypothetical protein